MYCYNCMKEIKEGTLCASCMIENDYENMPHYLQPGTMLNKKYFVGHVLGQGGFGITYIGFDTMLDVKVAIKEYYPNGYANRNNTVSNEMTTATVSQREFFDKGKERFLGEARSIAKFSWEPGIVGVRDYFEENGTAYLIMEYLDGQTLAKYVKRNGEFETKQLFTLMRPVMESLKKIHNEGIIHRDISPDNIMYLKDGTFKLMDFGAARHFTNEEKNLSVMLKKGYAPEEQHRTNGDQGPWTDVYGLCATMYRCITGNVPEDALDRLREDNIKKPSELGVEMPRLYEIILMYGLAVRKEDRCKDMAELLSLIDKVNKKEEIHVTAKQPAKKEDHYKTEAADEVYRTQAANDWKEDYNLSYQSSSNSSRVPEYESSYQEPKKNNYMMILAIVGCIAIIALSVLAGGLMIKNWGEPKQVASDSDEKEEQEIEETDDSNSASFSEEEVEEDPIVQTPIVEEPVEEKPEVEDFSYFQEQEQGFVFPDSDRTYLTKADLWGMTADECRLARNEIYARKGYIFKDKALLRYFKQFDWYVPKIKPNKFKETMLNRYEIANRDLIVEYETEQGYR